MEFKHETIDLGYGDLVADTQPTGRTYITPDGVRYPSITTVLGILSEAGIAAWRKRVGEDEANRVGGRASARGTLVHSIVEKYLLNENTKEYLPHIRQSLENLRPILDSRIGTIYGLEVPLYSSYLGVAGRCDCVAEFDGVPSIVDFKTSRKPKKKEWISNYFAQMAGYAVMWEERTGMPITNTVIIMDVDDNEPLVFKEHRDNHIQLLIDTKKEYDTRKLFSH
jgi:genome maintenance exonuclease 1|tara:strand:- start:395 stop:1066 length:672 start_codon:yes stop_codon:yes gene_type:complete